MAGELSIVPANEVSWDDLQTTVGPMRCHGVRCFCQRFKMGWAAGAQPNGARESTQVVPSAGSAPAYR